MEGRLSLAESATLTSSTRPKPPTPRVSMIQKSFRRALPSSCGMAGKLRTEKRAGNVVYVSEGF